LVSIPQKTNSQYNTDLAVARRVRSTFRMTLKIESAFDGKTATLRLSGRIEEDHIAEIQAEIRRYHPRLTFNLGEATLVDREVVCFLASQEMEGVELVECPRYIREWIARERSHECSFNPTEKENQS
jgi:hypothetical protein